jgi:gluconolactonase
MTAQGVQLVKGEWRYNDTRIIEVEHRRPDADGQPTGAAIDYTPHAGGMDFDDSRWAVLDPAILTQRRGHGRLSFNWYRINVTIPERVGNLETIRVRPWSSKPPWMITRSSGWTASCHGHWGSAVVLW